MIVVYTQAALTDLNGIADSLIHRNPNGAAKVESDIRATIDRLTLHPFSGRQQDEATVRKAVSPGYRYRIFYAVDAGNGVVQVLSILHPSRDG